MAEGRMLNRAISGSKRMADLSDDTSRLLFTWMIPHLDAEGRMKGEPSLFRAIVCPRLEHITTQKVESCLYEWGMLRLIFWYTAKGDKYIYCVDWTRQQRGLRKEREAQSRFPSPPNELIQSKVGITPDLLRSYSGVAPPSMPQNGIEWNGIERGTEIESETPGDNGKQPFPEEDDEQPFDKLKKAVRLK